MPVSRTYGKKSSTKRKASPLENDTTHILTKKQRRSSTPDAISSHRQPSTDLEDTSTKKLYQPITSSEAVPRTPTKLTKRMLGRSRTEPNIALASPSAMTRTQSMPVIPSSPSSPPNHSDELHESRPPLTTSVTTPRIKRTYAGHSRSFLISLPVGDLNPDAPQSVTNEGDEFFEQESYAALRARWGLDSLEDDPVVPSTSSSRNKSKPGSNSSTPRKGKGKAPAVYLPPGMMNPLKSITELRSKGESRRFMDEVGYLFEGMEPSSSLNLRRTSASEIVTKLCNEDFARKAKATDFYQKTWEIFLRAGAGRCEDKILDILMVFLASLITRDSDTLIELARHDNNLENLRQKGKEKEREREDHSLIGILFSILKNLEEIDPLSMSSPDKSYTDIEFKQAGFNKKERDILSSIYSTISHRSGLFSEGTSITTPLLATHTLRSLPTSLIPPDHLLTLLSSLRHMFESSFDSVNNVFPDKMPPQFQFQCVRNHLHLLDMYLLDQWSNTKSKEEHLHRQIKEALKFARDEWLADGLIMAGVCAEMTGTRNSSAKECLEVLLRVLVNLTHGDKEWAEKVVEHAYGVIFILRLLVSSGIQSSMIDQAERKPRINIEDSSDEDDDDEREAKSSSTLDMLCLALGLLTNLVQVLPEIKLVLQTRKLSLSCTSKNNKCAKTCHCLNAINGLQILAHIYANQQNIYSHHLPDMDIDANMNMNMKVGVDVDIKSEPSTVASTPTPTSAMPTYDINAEADASLIQGHLAILFGLLMCDCPSNVKEILSALPTPSPSSSTSSLSSGKNRINNDINNNKVKIRKLVEQAKEFVMFYNVMSSGSTEGEKDGKVAIGVVKFLEQLRDGGV